MQAAEIFTVSSEWMITNVAGLAVGLLIFIAGWIASGFVARGVMHMLPRARGIDNTIAPLLSQIARYAVLILTTVVALSQVGVQTTSLLAVLGAAGLAIALALQGTLSNIAAGVMLIWLRPMSTGEYIDGDGVSGTVVEIGLFGTRLRNANGVYVFAPNSMIWNARITNFSREPTRRVEIRVGIAYDSDIAKARTALLKIANGDERVQTDPAAVVYVEELGASSVNMLLRLWVLTPDYWGVLFEFNESAKLALDKAGIEIPFNQLDIKIAGGVETHPAPKPAAKSASKSGNK